MGIDEVIAQQARLQKELVDATADLVGLMAARVVALEKRVHKLEDVVREILQRTAGFGQRVGSVSLMEGQDRAERVRGGTDEVL